MVGRAWERYIRGWGDIALPANQPTLLLGLYTFFISQILPSNNILFHM